MARKIAVCWTTQGGNNMSRTHIADPTTGKTLCGIDRSCHLGPNWFHRGEPVAPGTLTHIGGHNCAVTCQKCWDTYEYELKGRE